MPESNSVNTRRDNSVTAIAILLVIFFLTIFSYQNGLKGPFLFDDEVHVTPLLHADLSGDKWTGYLLHDSSPLKRPVSMASFILNAVASGNDVFQWKYFNLMIHLLVAVCIYWFSYYLFSVGGFSGRRDAVALFALVPAVFWLLHPLFVSTVLYTVQRMTQLSTLFVFAALASYLGGRMKQLAGERGTPLILIAFFLFMPLGVLSKENALLFPIYALLVELFFLKFRIFSNHDLRVSRNLRNLLIALPIIAIVYVVLNAGALIFEGYQYRNFTLYQRFLTECRVLLIYILQLLVPVQDVMGFIHDDVQISTGWFSPPTTALSFILIVLLLIFAWYIKDKNPLAGFGIWFYFAAHLMESTIFPLEIMFEHRNYLPAYGIFLAVTAFIYSLINSNNIKIMAIVMVLLVFSVQTRIRADIWSSTEGLYSHMFRIHPDSERLASVQARILMTTGNYRAAMRLLSAFESNGSAMQQLHVRCYKNHSISDQELVKTRDSLEGPLDMYAISETVRLANYGLNGKCRFTADTFLTLLDQMLELPLNSDFQKQRLLVYKAHYLWKLHERRKAFATLEEAVEIARDEPIPLLIGAEWLAKSGDIDKAISYYKSARDMSASANRKYDRVFDAVWKLIENYNENAGND